MISKRTQENLVAAVVFILFATVLYLSYGYGPRARMVPVPIAVLGLIFIVAQVIWQNLHSGQDLHVDEFEVFTGHKKKELLSSLSLPVAIPKKGGGETPAAADSADGKSESKKEGWRHSQMAPFALVILILVAFLVLGPVPAVFWFTAGYFILSGQYKWLRGLIYTAVFTGVLYMMFGRVLEVDLNRGLIVPFINQFFRF
jgi:hypothetical protein